MATPLLSPSSLLTISLICTAPYFRACLSKEDLNEMRGSAELEKVRNTLYKAYLEDFYRYCTKELGGATGEVMGDLLKVRIILPIYHTA